MSDYAWLAAALFLPLFPFSMAFSVLARRLRGAWSRALLLLVWPQCGLWLLHALNGSDVPRWILPWAVMSALLYAFRAIPLRDAGLWQAYLSVSIGGVVWLLIGTVDGLAIELVTLALTLPLALLSLLTGEIEKRFGAAYAGLQGGMARRQPRLAGVFAVSMLAVIATPVFPGFFALLASTMAFVGLSPWLAAALLLVWLLWTWSGMRLLSGLLTGPVSRSAQQAGDLSQPLTMAYAGALLALALAGLALAGRLL